MIRSALAFVICAAFALTAPLAQAQSTDAQKLERNKKNVVEFYNAVLNEKDFDKAKTYVGATYIQHNPIGADGLEGIGQGQAGNRHGFLVGSVRETGRA